MKDILSMALLAGCIALATAAFAQATGETSDADARPPRLDGSVIEAAKRSLNDLPAEALAPGITRQVVHGTQSTFSRWELAAGTSVPLHHHVNEQITWIISGRAEVHSGGQTYELAAGDLMVFAPNVEHAFIIIEDTVAVDLFAPARQDWIDAAARAAERP
jgi:quercetin dioxygenase-like cupin family protein